jgi:hypothetical protein
MPHFAIQISEFQFVPLWRRLTIEKREVEYFAQPY